MDNLFLLKTVDNQTMFVNSAQIGTIESAPPQGNSLRFKVTLLDGREIICLYGNFPNGDSFFAVFK